MIYKLKIKTTNTTYFLQIVVLFPNEFERFFVIIIRFQSLRISSIYLKNIKFQIVFTR